MSRKPETGLIGRVHKMLPRHIDAEKTHNPFRGGIWDVYYESPNGLLWVEYKWAERLPKVIDLGDPRKKPSLSKLQQTWGEQRVANDIPCAVCAGFGRGRDAVCVWWNNEWNTPLESAKARLRTVGEVVETIEFHIRRRYSEGVEWDTHRQWRTL